MADEIPFIDPISGVSFPMDFADLITLIKGSSIRSAAIADNFFELGLTDAFNLRMENRPSIVLMSTLNKGGKSPG